MPPAVPHIDRESYFTLLMTWVSLDEIAGFIAIIFFLKVGIFKRPSGHFIG